MERIPKNKNKVIHLRIVPYLTNSGENEKTISEVPAGINTPRKT